MKTGYILIDLNSLVVYLETERYKFLPSINPNIFKVLRRLQSEITESEISLKVILFSVEGAVSLSRKSKTPSDVFYFKKNGLDKGLKYSAIVSLFKKFCKSFGISIELVSDHLPYLISSKLTEETCFDLVDFKKYLQVPEIDLTQLLLISSNKLLLDNLKLSEIIILSTHQDGAINADALHELERTLSTTPSPYIHWFVDIDQTLLLRHETKLYQRTILNSSLIEIIRSTAKHDSNIRISVLTARKNPFDQFNNLQLNLVKILNEFNLHDKVPSEGFIVKDSIDSYKIIDKLQEIENFIDTLTEGISLDIVAKDKLNEVKNEFSDYLAFMRSLSLWLVEDVKCVFNMQCGLDLLIEPFSYVDTSVASKAQTIYCHKQESSHYLLGSTENQIIIFSDDNEQELTAARELVNFTAAKLIVLPIHSDGDIEADYDKKLALFRENLSISPPIKNKKHKITLKNPSSSFWKKPRPHEEQENFSPNISQINNKSLEN